MAELIYGKPAADALTAETRRRADMLREKNVLPRLVILRCGENEADGAYIRGAMKRGGLCGVDVELRTLAENVSADELARALEAVNSDNGIHGCLLLRPLPGHLKAMESKLCALLDPKKDVDGMTPVSAAGVFTGSGQGFPPCTAQACMALLDYYHIDCAGKSAAVVGRSAVVGRPAAMLLLARNATVTVCHTGTKDVAAVTREADIIITAAGAAGSLTAAHVRPGQVVVDVSTNWNGVSLCGDAVFDDVSQIVEASTPVPGGVGAVTSAVLMAHTVRAAEYLTGEGGL